jgi:hypothetical protein
MVAKSNSIPYLSGLSLAYSMWLSGCLASSPKDPFDIKTTQEQIVVERSKASAPDWISLSTGIIVDSGSELRLMTRRSKLLNLTLGLEQSQIAALDAMRLAMTEKIQAQLQIWANDSGIKSTKAAKWQKLVFESVSTVGAEKLKVRDIYYEGVDDRLARSGSPFMHYYSVYVLIAYAKADFRAIYQDLASRLAVNDDAELKRLAMTVTRFSGTLP